MIIVGVDEAGVGCLAGPLIITAAAFNEKTKLSRDIKDSKRLSSRKREELIDEIYNKAEWIIVEVIPVSFINSCSNVWSAWTIGMTKLLKSCLKRINTVNTLVI